MIHKLLSNKRLHKHFTNTSLRHTHRRYTGHLTLQKKKGKENSKSYSYDLKGVGCLVRGTKQNYFTYLITKTLQHYIVFERLSRF